MANLVRVLSGGGVAPSEPITFSYTGNNQSYIVPKTGNYKLEVWGAQGGDYDSYNSQTGTTRFYGGKGGYAYGNVRLEKDQVIYIVVGGQNNLFNGGYNGGGHTSQGGAGGGGATHIGKSNALLKDTAPANVYIVAGGGGGASNLGDYQTGIIKGGSGGGTNGGNGEGQGGIGYGGTQTAGGGCSEPSYSYLKGSYGTGYTGPFNDEWWVYAGAGGGGYYGGGTGAGGWSGGGGGGSGYIGGCIEGTTGMQNGQRSGNGLARITYIGR